MITKEIRIVIQKVRMRLDHIDGVKNQNGGKQNEKEKAAVPLQKSFQSRYEALLPPRQIKIIQDEDNADRQQTAVLSKQQDTGI